MADFKTIIKGFEDKQTDNRKEVCRNMLIQIYTGSKPIDQLHYQSVKNRAKGNCSSHQ